MPPKGKRARVQSLAGADGSSPGVSRTLKGTKRRRIESTASSGIEAQEPSSSKTAPAGAPVQQSSKIFDLPVELFNEILSYFPEIPIPTTTIYYTPLLSPVTLERSDALRALSQTCRSFREVLLPLLWQRLDASAIRFTTTAQDADTFRRHEIPTNWYLGISQALERKSLGLLQNPQFAAHVQLVNVTITRCSTSTVLPAFVRCLESLPNVHTLQIVHAHTQMTSHFKDHFEGHILSTIRTVVLPSHAHNVLRCCPEARKVVCNYDDGSKLVSAIAKECRKVEEMAGFKPDQKMMKRIIKAAPNLHTFRFGLVPSVETVNMLGSVKHISTVEIKTWSGSPLSKEEVFVNPEFKDPIRAAKAVLTKSKSDRKELIIAHSVGWTTRSFAWREVFEL
ncbi:hypothetical protein AX16_007448 [Volvariella volvacea WC 439]|nr:hypothetical protein AX16_007448 [Volvariella volvacea WC 439]